MADHRLDPGSVDRYDGFPDGFFARADESSDRIFYGPPRLVTHLDKVAIAAVGRLYEELGLHDRVLDLCGSWISHFRTRPDMLVVHGMNASELAANEHAVGGVIADLNRTQRLPFRDRSFDAATCCVSVDYLTRPIEVFDEVGRVLSPGGLFCHVFSNRCFPTKAIRGWLATDQAGRVAIVAEYFRRSGRWTEPAGAEIVAPGLGSDPLHAVWARRRG